MAQVCVVGSGASGVHFALTLLERGHDVTMVDVGFEAPAPVLPDATYPQLRERLDDPSAYFLGDDLGSVVLPGRAGEFYGFPPGKSYVFRQPRSFGFNAAGFAPLFSFARGGLAQVWTGGCYPMSDEDLAAFPFGYAELGPHYDTVARRIGVSGTADDLARFLPVHAHLLEPLKLDEHSALLLDAYAKRRERMNRDLGCYVGRTRVATLTRPQDGRGACDYLGRCLWGCPVGALYTPGQTLKVCQAHPRFTYRAGLQAEFFRVGTDNRVTALVARPVAGGERVELPVQHLALAAGTLSSTGIFLRSVQEATGETRSAGGLMDNRQVLVPFVTLKMIGKRFEPARYQYHVLGLGLDAKDPKDYVHGQITTLKAALVHPIVQALPFDLRTSLRLTRAMHAALGVLNVNFGDDRRPANQVTLAPGEDGPRVAVSYTPAAGEGPRVSAALGRLGRALRALGCVVPPGLTHVRPMGASVHYAGTLPMQREAQPFTTSPECRSHDYPNLFLVDGATFPSLPAKNLTFTLMANAVRIATAAF